MKTRLLLFALICSSYIISFAQIVEKTDFEQFSNGLNFTKTSWETAGFTLPWVNGFDSNRGSITNSFSVSGSKSLRLFYPKDNFGPSNTGGQAPLILPPSDEYYSSYNVRFSDNFSWGNTSEGGKLPGLSGGERCSGCQKCTGLNGFSARLMWRTGGKAVIYLYHLNKANPECGDNFEIMVDDRNLLFQKGVWYKISQRVKVNSGNNKDGEVEIWINNKQAKLKLLNGTLVDKLTGIQFVSNGDKVNSFYFSTFHGGNDASWAPTVDCFAWFDDVIISTRLSDVIQLSVSSIETEKEESKDSKTEIYPNPLKQGEDALISGISENSVIEWTDMLGNVVAKSLAYQIGKTKTPSLISGAYFLRYTEENSIIIKKVFVD